MVAVTADEPLHVHRVHLIEIAILVPHEHAHSVQDVVDVGAGMVVGGGAALGDGRENEDGGGVGPAGAKDSRAEGCLQ